MCPFCGCNTIEFLMTECCWDLAEFFDEYFRLPTEAEVILWQEEKEEIKDLYGDGEM